MSTFLLLLGFALFKIVVGLTLVYVGLRGGDQNEPEDGFGGVAPDGPPQLPARRKRRVCRSAQGGPARAPVRVRPRRLGARRSFVRVSSSAPLRRSTRRLGA